ncbi:MAG: hypothetical protein WCM76_09545 [Bacteroidota bacterium]
MNVLRIYLLVPAIALLSVIALTSCHSTEKKAIVNTDSIAAAAKDSASLKQSGTLDGAKQLMARFMAKGADYAALTNSLKPTIEDAKAIFIKAEDAEIAFKYATKTFKKINKKGDFIKPKDSVQQNFVILSATAKELKENTGNAKEFTGGMLKIAPKLKDDISFFERKFVKKSPKDGMNFNGLTFVNNHWVMFFKLWKPFEENKNPNKPSGKKKDKKKKKKKADK